MLTHAARFGRVRVGAGVTWSCDSTSSESSESETRLRLMTIDRLEFDNKRMTTYLVCFPLSLPFGCDEEAAEATLSSGMMLSVMSVAMLSERLYRSISSTRKNRSLTEIIPLPSTGARYINLFTVVQGNDVIKKLE
jgi:hypothetical protein